MLYFRALASGSSGNSYLLRTDKVTLLFDAGLSLSALRRHLLAEGIEIRDLTAILVSHEHRDHCAAIVDLLKLEPIPVWGNADVLRACGLDEAPSASVLDIGRPMLFGDTEVTTFPVEHDAAAPVGFLARTSNRTIAIATDLGVPTQVVCDAVAAADLAVIEANHDPEMLHSGRYPYHLRRRVSGPKGHLSNQQTGTMLAGVIRPETEVWLAHLSKENNTAALAVRTVKSALKFVGLTGVRVDVAQRDRPSLRWHGTMRPTQLGLFDSIGAI